MKKIANSIKTQLTVITLLLVAIPLALIIVISTRSTITEGEENVVEINDAQASIVESSIADVLDQNMAALQSLAASPSTVMYLSGGGDEALESDLMNQLLAIDSALADGNSTIITGADGMQLLRSVGDPVDVSDREYFQKAMSGTLYVSDIQISKSTGSRISTFAAPVYDENHENVIGMVQRNYDLSDFHDLIASEVTEERQEIVIVDRNGDVVAHSSHEIDPENPESQAGNPFYTDSRGDQMTGDYVSVWAGDTWMISWIKEPKTGWVIASCRIREVALSRTNMTAALTIVLGIAFLVVAAFVTIFSATRIAKPIQQVADAANKMSKGDLSIPDINVKAQNEVGVLAGAFNKMKDMIAGVLHDAQDSASIVADSSSQFSTVSEQSADALTTIAQSSTELAEGAANQKAAVTDASDMVDSMVLSIENIRNNSVEIADASTEVSNDAAEGKKELDQAVVKMHELQSSIENTNQVMEELSEQSQKIGQIVDTISSIAEQTNLLSLNASIEAARAGEAGRGFAVVATEVGSLAIESRDAVSEIAGIVQQIQQQTEDATKSMAIGTEQTAESAEIVEKAAETFSNIAEEINGLVGRVRDAVNVAESTMDSGNQVKSAIDRIDGIATDIVDNTSTISASTEEQTASVQEIAASSKQMHGVADTLKGQIGMFKLTAEDDAEA